jgi:hypothetical protein
MNILHFSHVLVGLLLLYISIKRDVYKAFYYIVLLIAIIALIHHGYKFIKSLNWLYLFHLIVIIPILFVLGILQNKSPEYVFEILMFIAFGTIGFHGYKILKDQLNIYHGSLLAIILIILFV